MVRKQGEGSEAKGTAREVARLKERVAALEAAEKALQESEIKYRTLFESAHDAVFLMENGLFTDCNSATLRMFACTRQQILGRSPAQFSPPLQPDGRPSGERAQELMEAALAGRPQLFQWRHIRLDGASFDAEVSLNGMDLSGRSFLLAFVRDVTERRRAEEALRESEREYRAIFENAVEGFFQSTPEGRFIRVNRSLARMCGFDSPEQMCAEITDIMEQHYVRPEDREVFGQLLAERDVVENFEHETYRRDGSTFWASVSARAVRDAGGRLLYYEGTEENIDTRRQAERLLADAEEQYRSLFEISTNAILIRNRVGIITMVNGAALSLLGAAEPAELIGRAYLDFVHPDDRPLSIERIERIFEAASKRHLPAPHEEAAIHPREHRMVRLGGEVILVESTGVAFHHKGELFIQGIFRDITARARAEAALRESEERYRLLVETGNDAIFIAQDGVIKFPNRKTRSYLGYSAAELETIPFIEHVHPDDRDMVLRNYRQRLEGSSSPETYTFRVVTRSGDLLWVEISAAPVVWEGRPATLNFVRDITVQKQLESQVLQSHKMEAVGTLAGGVAHDFNNILMGIQGYATLMKLDLEPGHPHHERLQRIEDQVRSAAHLTRQLLGFARGGRYEVKPVSLNEVIARSAELFGRTKKEVTIHRRFAQDLHPVEADQGQMEQVFLNLLLNAGHAMPSGGDLYLETRNLLVARDRTAPLALPRGTYAVASVTDTGVGMDQKTIGRIFEPFFTTREMGRGTGLGLAMVYGIVKGHGGFIDVHSQVGRGSTFTVYLPAAEGQVQAETPPSLDLLPGSETILLVDDEEAIIDVHRQILRSLGYRVLEARSGTEAVELFKEKGPGIALIILDMIMPGLSGRETFDRIRAIDPDARIILCSGYSLDGQAQAIMDKGCAAFLQKPFDVALLSHKIREVLKKTTPPV